ncbi:MAG: sigma-70 family RNA polymerase sigma factor [Bacteroidota bacterium]
MKAKYSDQALIDMIHRGGEDLSTAMHILYGMYNDRLLQWLRNRREEDAEDICHEAMVNLIESVLDQRFKNNSTIYTYLVAIAKKLCLKKRDRAGRDERFKNKHTQMDLEEIDPEVLMMTTELREMVELAMKRLKPKNREVLRLWMRKYSMKEIADKMGYQSPTVARITKSRSLAQLVNLIGKDQELSRTLRELI